MNISGRIVLSKKHRELSFPCPEAVTLKLILNNLLHVDNDKQFYWGENILVVIVAQIYAQTQINVYIYPVPLLNF